MSQQYAVDNLDALTQTLTTLDSAVSESLLRQAAVAGARLILEEAKCRAPVGNHSGVRKGNEHYPGFLRDHLIIAYDNDVSVPGRLASYIVTWSKDAFYGRFIELGKKNAVRLSARTLARAIHDMEFGSSATPAQPFLRPAFEARKADAASVSMQIIDQKLRETRLGQ
ncbi:HK97-gp10 family putative phage morphogenesis protein [Paraburkholderia caribensis]|uniref:HK97-gp10 family putative phage morphogenesis protein n=1 Tax=Paraburkholderia caribensis TaxID=75105 RepID=UPI001CAE4ACB|nr:HK97-gp10 family putative phage morphogenesis protein [Paraburkholderia caribensis]CAG9262219.1 HK97 family phage protein [Paraburkholderia caribensis]